MVNNDESEELYKPSLVITTSIRTSPLTNTLVKTLSRLLNAPVIRRGTSNLDEIAYFVASEGYEGFIIIYTRLGTPSALTLYRLTKRGFFRLYGRIFLLGIYINRKFKKHYETLSLVRKCSTPSCDETYFFLRDYFVGWETRNKLNKNHVNLVINDLEELREKWLTSDKGKNKLSPSILEFIDPAKGIVILKLKVHHVWKFKQA